jgi:hypothetical protein
MKLTIIHLSSFLAIVLLFSCSDRRPIGRNADARYIEDSSEKGLVNLDKINSQDFTRAANKLLQDLFTRGALTKAPDQPAILHVGEIRNVPEAKRPINMPRTSGRNWKQEILLPFTIPGPSFRCPGKLSRRRQGLIRLPRRISIFS